MAAYEARGRGDGPLEHYVRQLLRDADRARRTTQPRTRSDTGVQDDRSLLKPLLHPPEDALTDNPPSAG